MQLFSVSISTISIIYPARFSSHAIILVTPSNLQVPLLHPMCGREHSEVSLAGFESWFCDLLAVRPLVGHVTSPNLHFLMCKDNDK